MKILNMFIKDLKIFLSDKEALITLILMPLILIMILSFALKGNFQSAGISEPIKVGLVKEYDKNLETDKFISSVENDSSMGQDEKKLILDSIVNIDPENILFENFLELPELKKVLDTEVMTASEAEAALKAQEIRAVVHIPKDYIYSMHVNMLTPKVNKITVKVEGHPDYTFSGSIVYEVFNSFTDIVSLSSVNRNVFLSVATENGALDAYYANMEKILSSINKIILQEVVKLQDKAVEGANPINSFAYYTLAMLSMFVLFSAGIVARSLLIEKDNITYDRMIACGGNDIQLLISKFAVIFILCILQILAVIIVSALVFQIKWAFDLSMAAVSLLLALSTAGLGVLIGAISLRTGNYKLTSAFESVIIQIMALFGGSYIPIQVLPPFMQGVGQWTINGLALDAYLKIFQGLDYASYSTNLIRLVFITAVCVIVGFAAAARKGGRENVKSVNTEN
ncbi:MAG: ABC transporter permease [Eubacteriaceae bacterium]|nr:ABC transporter permease [Eubacteriaceae bacterium]